MSKDIIDEIISETEYIKYEDELIAFLQERINDLNDIIENIDKENENLSKENEKLRFFIQASKCKYPPYMVKDIIYKEIGNTTSNSIVRLAEKNDMFDNENYVMRIPRKRNSKDKFASTVVFSLLGVVKIISIIQEQLKENNENNFSKNDIDISLEQLKNGEVIKYEIKDLLKMEK